MVVIFYKSSSLVLKGMLVDAGEILEISGNSGMSTGSHLYLTKYGKVIVLVILLYLSKRVQVYYNKD